ncbi:MAG: cupredoxin domain-containing protein [Archangiaceae bacterium]|nr:cupredoxin domain-containing protein [Archangiaceae bacterium]
MNSSRICLALAALGFATACNKPPPPPPDGAMTIQVTVGASGYTPARVTAKAGEKVRLVFTRKTDEGCGQQLVVPSLEVRKDLPLDTPVPVDLTMPAKGEVAFTCGMAMYEGAVVVQ